MTALYAITNDYLALAEKLASLDLDAATIADTIEASGLGDDLAVKAQGITHLAREAVRFNDQIDAEIERLRALKVQREKIAAGLHQYLLDNMQRAGISKIDCPLFSLSIRHNPPAVEVLDSADVPPAYWRTPEPKPPVAVIDKLAIKADLQAGKEVPGARLVKHTRLEIR